MQDLVLSPSDFVAVLNQTLETAYPSVTIEGELSNFKVAKNRWVYFDLKDEAASVRYFGTVYQLPGPLEDGLMVRAVGLPRLHPRFGFTINLESILPVGEGSLKKAADLLLKKLEAEGLFAPERKRLLPFAPTRIGLITAASSAAYADFIKITNERWGGVEIWHIDVLVQGDQSPTQLVAAIEHFNQLSDMPEVLVLTRGGGSAEDLAAFSDERVVRAVVASRIPTLVAIGHEVDISLAELAADQRASTPTNAAQLLVPERQHELVTLQNKLANLRRVVDDELESQIASLQNQRQVFQAAINNLLLSESERLKATRRLIGLFNPEVALKRGYAILSKGAVHISSVAQVRVGDPLNIRLADGKIKAQTKEVERG